MVHHEQLALQWPTSAMTYDDLIEIEELLIERLSHGEVDGHDTGHGEANVFVRTDDPVRTFAVVRELLGDDDNWKDIRAADREATGDVYTVLWPEGLMRFEVA
jgi:hypothetical protein